MRTPRFLAVFLGLAISLFVVQSLSAAQYSIDNLSSKDVEIRVKLDNSYVLGPYSLDAGESLDVNLPAGRSVAEVSINNGGWIPHGGPALPIPDESLSVTVTVSGVTIDDL